MTKNQLIRKLRGLAGDSEVYIETSSGELVGVACVAIADENEIGDPTPTPFGVI